MLLRSFGWLALFVLLLPGCSGTNPPTNVQSTTVLPAQAGRVSSVSGTDPGHFAYVGTMCGIFVIDLGTFAEKAFIDTGCASGRFAQPGVAINAAKTKLYFASNGTGIQVIDIKTNAIVHFIPIPDVTFSAFNPVINEAYAIADNYFYVIDSNRDVVVAKFRENLAGHSIGKPVVDPGGHFVWNANEAGINVYNVGTRRSSQIVDSEIAQDPGDANVIFGKDGSKVYAAPFTFTLAEIYSATTHKIIGHLSQPVSHPMAIDPTGRYLYTVNRTNGTVVGTRKFDLTTGQLIKTYTSDPGWYGIAVGPSGDVYEGNIYVGSRPGGLIVLDPVTGISQNIPYSGSPCHPSSDSCDGSGIGNFIM